MPGFLDDYFGKLKAFGLPYFHKKYPNFTSEWFVDFEGKFEKIGVQHSSKQLFVPSKAEIRECILSSYPHLTNPAMSQKVHLIAWTWFFDAQMWAINDNEHKFDKD